MTRSLGAPAALRLDISHGLGPRWRIDVFTEPIRREHFGGCIDKILCFFGGSAPLFSAGRSRAPLGGRAGPRSGDPGPRVTRALPPSGAAATPRVRATAAGGLCAALRRAGAAPEPLLEALSLSERAIEAEPLSWLDLAGYCGLLESAAARSGHAGLGWEVGLSRGPALLGEVAEAVDTAPTLAAGLAAASRCFPALQEQTRVRLDGRPGGALLSYQIRDGRILHRRQDAELSLGALIGLVRRTLGPHWRPEEIHLEHDPRRGRAVADGLGATPVYGAQPCNGILLSGADLASVMPGADPRRHGEVLRRLAGRLQERRQEDFIGLVLQHIRDALAEGRPGIAPVARRLGLSGPALYRRLDACGVAFSELQSDMRRALALDLLAAPDLRLTEIALRLGYSELSAFSRAFAAGRACRPGPTATAAPRRDGRRSGLAPARPSRYTGARHARPRSPALTRPILCDTVPILPRPDPALLAEAQDGAATRARHDALVARIPALGLIEARQAPGPVEPPPATLRVAAWNLERCTAVEASAALLARSGAGVALLSEMDLGMARSGNRHTTADLAAALGAGHAFGVEFVELGAGFGREIERFGGDANAGALHGNALVSRLPFRDVFVVPLDAGGAWFGLDWHHRRIGGRMAIGATVDLAAGPVLMVSVHLENRSTPEERRAAMARLAAALPPGAPAVVAGDLNGAALPRGEAREGSDWFARPAVHEPLFAAMAEAGFDWRACNTPDQTRRAVPDGRPAPWVQRIDWFFTRGVAASAPRTWPAVAPDGAALSDHELITVDIG